MTARRSAEDILDENTSGVDENEPVSVVAFPSFNTAALQGLPGKIVEGVLPYTEAHQAAILVQLLCRFGVEIGADAHVLIANTKHPARINPLIVGKTSDGAKGTSHEVVAALFRAAYDTPTKPTVGRLQAVSWRMTAGPARKVSGLSTGEGLIELVRDANGDDPEAKGYDEGVDDKRLLVVESEFAGTMAMMERQGNSLSRVVREAWETSDLQSLSRHSPLAATGAHISVVGHVTPGEFRIKTTEAQILGGTVNRFIPTASRRTKLRPDGGNIPADTLAEFAPNIRSAIDYGRGAGQIERTAEASKLWNSKYGYLSRARPDGPVASILGRARVQVLRLALIYALFDERDQIDHEHLTAALALWDYADATAEWMYGAHVDTAEIEDLITFIASAGAKGRTRTEIYCDHFQKHKKAAEIRIMLHDLIKDGRVRQETVPTAGAPMTRYFAC